SEQFPEVTDLADPGNTRETHIMRDHGQHRLQAQTQPGPPHIARYRLDGKSRQRAFATSREATEFKAQVEYKTRKGTFADPALGRIPFVDYAGQVVATLDMAEDTKANYRQTVTRWLAPWAGKRTLAQMATDRDEAIRLLNETMAGLSDPRRRTLCGHP